MIPATFDHATPATLDQLNQQGAMISPVTAKETIYAGELSAMLQKLQGFLEPRDTSHRFSRSDGTIYAYVNWVQRTNIKGTSSMSLYNADNQQVAMSKPVKLNVQPGAPAIGVWYIPVATLPSDYYVWTYW